MRAANRPMHRPGKVHWSRWTIAIFAAYALAAAGVIALQVHGQGILSHPSLLNWDLKTNADGWWTFGLHKPLCFRPLYRWITLAIFELMPYQDQWSFYRLYLTLAGVSLFLAAMSFHVLQRTLGFRPRQAVLGCLLMLCAFPVLFSHDVPTHTREDFLGYTMICVALTFAARDCWWGVALTAACGAWVRETCLLGVLPYFFISARPLWQRFSAYAIPGISLLLVRVLRNANQGVDEGGSYLIDLIGTSTLPAREFPAEALIYAFAAFGFVWGAAGIHMLRNREVPALLRPPIVGLAALAVIGTGWTLGMVRESRIVFILFPFLIPHAVLLLTGPELRRILRSKTAWASAGAVTFCLALLAIHLMRSPQQIDRLRPYINERFNLGVPHPELVQEQRLSDGSTQRVDMAWSPAAEAFNHPLHASRLNGPHVALNLVLVAFLLGGTIATRKDPQPPPSPARPETHGDGSDGDTQTR
jgi:hypothetical protein